MKTTFTTLFAAATLVCLQMAFTEPTPSAPPEIPAAKTMAETLAGAAGHRLGEPSGAAIGAAIGVKTAEALNHGVSRLIDRHFDAMDQKFSNRTGITIHDSRGTIKPRVKEAK